MCGLIFHYKPGAPREELYRRASAALNRIAHRGPDDEGLIVDTSLAIGHRRLAILDLAASRQPMQDPTKRYTLTYNGEIYNFRELRAGLESRWSFLTHGDTEVLLAGLILEGERFLQRMEGMWAFAFWDAEARKLLLARDRMGKKPLYYQRAGESFSCASELAALSVLDSGAWLEDIDSTADYLRYGYYLPGFTAYQGVFEVLPGHVLTWSSGSEVSQRQYWAFRVGGFSGTHLQAKTLLREKLIYAVQRRLIADVEIGAFLSGGIDSSLIVCILTRELGVHPKTFTIGFRDRSFDEREYAQVISRDCGTDHYEEVLEEWDRKILERLLIDHVGQPFMDASLLPTAMVSRLAGNHVKVALSGDGGDELFCGYQRYQARMMLRWYTRLPKSFRGSVATLIKILPEPMVHHSHSVLKKAHLFLDIVDRQAIETPYVAPVYYADAAYRALAPDLVNRGQRPPGLPSETCPDDLIAMMATDVGIYLPQDILAKVDRASMAYSLETRSPFLDREVVELALSLPSHWHRRGVKGKRMLGNSFADLLPANIRRRRKQGFSVPLHTWFREKLGDDLLGMLEQDITPLVPGPVLDMLALHREGRRDFSSHLWGIYAYMLWRCSGYGLAR